MRAPLFRDAPGTPERPSGHRRDGGESFRNSSWLSGRATRNTAAVSVVLLLLLAAVGQFGTEREWNAGLREMVRARVESAGVASAVRRVQTLEEISDGMAHRGEGGMRSVAGGERTGRESAPPPPRVFDIKLRGDETEETEQAFSSSCCRACPTQRRRRQSAQRRPSMLRSMARHTHLCRRLAALTAGLFGKTL